MEEEWRPIKGWKGYFVSNLGRVSGKRVEILKLYHSRRGGDYPFVDLRKVEDGIPMRWCAKIHNLVAEAFLGPRQEGMVVHHIDGNRDNCRVENLEYVTVTQNAILRGFYSYSNRREAV